jgi:hypothetical protein
MPVYMLGLNFGGWGVASHIFKILLLFLRPLQ